MAGKVIAHLVGWYIPNGQPNANGMDGLTIDGGYLLEAQRMHAELERRARGQPLAVEIDIKPVRDKRTLDQNRLMWALLNRLALALSGDIPGGVTVELLDNGECIVKVGVGSSNFDRAQMRDFIDRIFDRLYQAGVDDVETTQQYRDWRRVDELH